MNMLEVFHYYNDLCREIDILETQLKVMETEREDWWIGGRLFHSVPMDRAAEKFDHITSKMELYEKLIASKRRTRIVLEAKLKQFEGLEYQVAYKRFVEKRTLCEIADELGYSEAWIKEVSSKVKRKLEEMDNLLATY